MKAFCVDANVFIEAHRTRYPMDIAPGFWDALLAAAREQRVFSIVEVYKELSESGDELSVWAKRHRDDMFLPNDDAATQGALEKVGAAIDARRPAYIQAAKAQFLNGADPWLIAYCEVRGHVLVTEEAGDPGSTGRVKIPDICAPLGVSTMRMLPMLRALNVRLVSG